MSKDRETAARRTRRVEQWLRDETGDTAWSATFSRNPQVAMTRHLINLSHPLIEPGIDRCNLTASTDFDAMDRLRSEPRGALLETMRRMAWRAGTPPKAGMDRVWAHPLAISLLSTTTRNARDLSRRPVDSMGSAVDVIGGAVISSTIMLNPGGSRWMSTRPFETQLIIDELPMAITAGLAGRPLGDLFSFAPTGRRDVDDAVDSLSIERAETGVDCTSVTLAPVDWLLYGTSDIPTDDRPYLAVNSFPPMRPTP